jgi:hypothetical protein
MSPAQQRQLREAHGTQSRTRLAARLADPDTAVWDMLADDGIDLDAVGRHPDGTWLLVTGPASHIAFGPATTETGAAAPGWNWASYDPDDEITGQDWVPDFQALLAVLRQAGSR